MILARATISMAGMPVGKVANVDPTVPYIAAALKKGYLVPVGGTEREGVARSSD